MSEGQRYYLVCKCEGEREGALLGIFSNQKNFMDAISVSNINMKGTYIKGKRKNIAVSSGAVSQALTGRNLTIYKEDEPYIKVLVLYMNESNPVFKRANK